MITSFKEKYSFLSNMYLLDIPVIFNGLEYPTVEHAYVSAKTSDVSIQKYIQSIQSPYKVKTYGRTLDIIPYWNRIKLTVMTNLVTQKFTLNGYLGQLLLDTGDQLLVEGNTWNDTYWGQCPVGIGENHLGKILMEVRETFKSEKVHD